MEGHAMRLIAWQNKKGLTLVEVMMALLILLFVSLALMQTALLSIDANVRNLLRDEAVNIAEARLREFRNRAWDHADIQDTGGTVADGSVTREFKNFQIAFTRQRNIGDLNIDNKQVNVIISWTWKGENFNHNVTTVMRRQSGS